MTSPTDGYFVLAIGFVSAMVLFISTLILPGFFPVLFDSARWTIKKELIWNFCMFVTLVLSFAITATLFNIQGLLSLTIFRSGALALLPLVLFNLLSYNNSLKERISKAIDTGRHWLSDEHIKPKVEPPEIIQLKSENGKEVFKRDLKDIILIQSASNYIEIFYREGSGIRKRLIRQTLHATETHLDKYDVIKKCHRSFLVNLEQITRIAGTPSKHLLEVEGLGFRIPLSRQKVDEFKKLFSSK